MAKKAAAEPKEGLKRLTKTEEEAVLAKIKKAVEDFNKHSAELHEGTDARITASVYYMNSDQTVRTPDGTNNGYPQIKAGVARSL